jgi:hypothetical protein
VKITTALSNVIALALVVSPTAAQFGSGTGVPGNQLPVGDERQDDERQADERQVDDPTTSPERKRDALLTPADTRLDYIGPHGSVGAWTLVDLSLLDAGDALKIDGRTAADPSGFRPGRPVSPIDVHIPGTFIPHMGLGVASDADAAPSSSLQYQASTASGSLQKADASVLEPSAGVPQQPVSGAASRVIQTDSVVALASAEIYGTGFAGTLGTPQLSYLGSLTPGSTIQLFAENSAGVTTYGYLRAGYNELHQTLRTGATLLCDTSILLMRINMPVGTVAIDFTIPADALSHGSSICAQVLVADSNAAGGFAFTNGLKLFL